MEKPRLFVLSKSASSGSSQLPSQSAEAEQTEADWAHVAAMVRSATANPSGFDFLSPVRCLARVGDAPCRGFLRLVRLDLPSEIRFRCMRCAHQGRVVRWRKSLWDLSDWAPYQIDEVVVWLTPKEHQTLTECQTLDRPAQVAVFRSRPQGKRIRLGATIQQAMHLQDRVVAESSLEEQGTRRRRLVRLHTKIGEAIPLFRQFRVNGPRFEEARFVGASESEPTPDADDSLETWSVSSMMRRLEAEARDLLSGKMGDRRRDSSGGFLEDGDWDAMKIRLAEQSFPELNGLSLREMSRLLWSSRTRTELELAPRAWVKKRVDHCPSVRLARRLLTQGVPPAYRDLLRRTGARSELESFMMTLACQSASGRFRTQTEQDMARRFLPEIVEQLTSLGLLDESGESSPAGRDLARRHRSFDLYQHLFLSSLDEIERRFGELVGHKDVYRLGWVWLHLIKQEDKAIDSLHLTQRVTTLGRFFAPDLPDYGVERIWLGYGLPAFVALSLAELPRRRSAGSLSRTAVRSSPLLSRGIEWHSPAKPETHTGPTNLE